MPDLSEFMEYPEGDDIVVLSSSEVDAWNDCKRKHNYAHVQQLEAGETNERMMLGTIGHTFLEHRYKALQAGASPDTAYNLGIDAMGDEHYKDYPSLVGKAIPLVANYHAVYENDTSLGEILYIEQEFYYFVGTHPNGKRVYFGMKPDLVTRRAGRAGITVVDHKFTGRFYSADWISMAPQMVRYSHVLGYMGLNLHDLVYNQVHTSPPKKASPTEQVDRVSFKPSMSRDMATWADTIETMNEIISADGKAMRRSPGSMKCGFCFAQPLCNAEQNGQDTTLMRQYNYKPNTYGYHKDSDA